MVTPVDASKLKMLLEESNYPRKKTADLINGFINGFYIGYEGPKEIVQESKNLQLRVGSKLELWNKVMKEVKDKRFAGPYKKPPFKHYIQSPIGLVPKDGGRKTRMIFHLSHPRDKTK